MFRDRILIVKQLLFVISLSLSLSLSPPQDLLLQMKERCDYMTEVNNLCKEIGETTAPKPHPFSPTPPDPSLDGKPGIIGLILCRNFFPGEYLSISPPTLIGEIFIMHMSHLK